MMLRMHILFLSTEKRRQNKQKNQKASGARRK